jgi:hypothetical protein
MPASEADSSSFNPKLIARASLLDLAALTFGRVLAVLAFALPI